MTNTNAASGASGQMTGATTIIVMPTYNESATLRQSLEHLRSVLPEVTVLVVDDNSPDGTGAIAEELAAADALLHVLHRPGKAGLGAAYIAGFRWALTRGAHHIVEMDADGSHRPEDLRRILEAATGADLVIGSRWVAGGRIENWSRPRQWLSRAGNTYVRLMLQMPVRDATAGFRVFSAAALGRLDLADVHSAGYCFQVDMTRRVLRAGLTVHEIPITFVERRAGESKMSGAIVREALWRVTVWGIADRVQRLIRFFRRC